ncbi:T9SS type A sorting domain-containing protein [Bizionia saleffrena]|uniref:T9SS type A sorting domain-containing protein n=1 Tax=Bizionia saleffrena TaxID=291189 RepID=A0A8H2LF10_9FLAO|nr:M4 family metallopeptidase [Bizionia saleffrena]TYB70494.1 T9SS type A sorting domain-containing protein [Bizionia saleffrena]
MKNIKLILFSAFLTTALGFSQSNVKAIAEFQKKNGAKITVNASSGIPDFIAFKKGKGLQLKGNSLQSKALYFLEENKAIFKMDAVNSSFKTNTPETDSNGLKRIVLVQTHQGVPVFDGKLVFHFNAKNELTAVNGNYISGIKLNATATVSSAEANALAIQEIENQNLNFSGASLEALSNTLYIFNKGLVKGYIDINNLAYKIEVANKNDVREYVFIDAHSGSIVEQYTGMPHVLDRVVYEENTSDIVWQEGDAFPNGLTIWQQNEVEASGHTYHFFKNAFNYVSYNNTDAQMKTINNNPNISCPNANWNGYTANYCDGTATDDVIAHEWGHAYTEYTSGLIYAYQSGALNESFSDIWGETIDLLNGYEDADDNQALRVSCGSSDRWRIGEDATAFGGAIRDMWNPNCNGDPGKVSDFQYRCGEGDAGGVHSNSGIPNRAYSLIVDGGTFNSYTVSGIGFTKAAHIFWRAQSQYLTATSNFTSLADALEASANDLIGINLEGLSTVNTPAGLSGEIITAADVTQVINAIFAVELRINPDSCNYSPILSEIAPLCDNATNNPIYFQDWESGMGNWSVAQLPVNAMTWEDRDWIVVNALPSERTGSAIFGADPVNGNCSTDFENGIMRLESPVITMPDFSNGNYNLSFNHFVSTEPDYDGGNIKYSLDGATWALLPASAFVENAYNSSLATVAEGNDNPLAGEGAFTGSDEGSFTGSWGTSVVDLSVLGVNANSTIQFRFEVGTDGCNGREGWYVDEFMVYNCNYSLSTDEVSNVMGSIKIFPNPSNGIFTIQKTESVTVTKAEIYDINGRFVRGIDLSNMTTNTTIDMSDVASGLYFMSITTDTTQQVLKIVKQ